MEKTFLSAVQNEDNGSELVQSCYKMSGDNVG